MKIFCIYVLLVVAFAGGASILKAQTNDLAASPAVTPSAREKATLEKHINPIMVALNLNNADQEAKVRMILAAHLKELNAWHAQNDPQIKTLWNQFNKARGKQDQTSADAALVEIDTVYASFKPEHDKFISELSSVLTPDQVETVKDTLTINKVKITFNAYGEIFPGLTDEQKAFILKNLKAAREEAIDAGAMTEKSAFFKKYKIRIESYLTSQGYNVKQAYKDFVAKQKAGMAEDKSAGTTPEEQKQ